MRPKFKIKIWNKNKRINSVSSFVYGMRIPSNNETDFTFHYTAELVNKKTT